MMQIFGIIFAFLLLCIVIIFIPFQMFNDFKKTPKKKKWKKAGNLIASAMIIYGAIGFLGAALSALGGFNWVPQTVEFPMSRVESAAMDNKGFFYCPSWPIGRIQVYDSKLNFIRGWHVNAYGGGFKICLNEDENIEAITIRKSMLYIFNKQGELLSSKSYEPKSYDEFCQNEGYNIKIPTPFYLWPLSSPFFAFPFLMGGIILGNIVDKKKKRKKIKKSK